MGDYKIMVLNKSSKKERTRKKGEGKKLNWKSQKRQRLELGLRSGGWEPQQASQNREPLAVNHHQIQSH